MRSTGLDSGHCVVRSGHGPDADQQGLAVDKLLYFFLGVRKGDIRLRAERLRQRYPGESPAQLSARVVAAQRPLSALGGVLLGLPALLPASAVALKMLGVAGAASALAQMHVAMLLEIAHLHGFDVDDRARLKEMAIVLAATGLAGAVPAIGWRIRKVGVPMRLATGTMVTSSVSQLIGQAAIAYYQRRLGAPRLQVVSGGRDGLQADGVTIDT